MKKRGTIRKTFRLTEIEVTILDLAMSADGEFNSSATVRRIIRDWGRLTNVSPTAAANDRQATAEHR